MTDILIYIIVVLVVAMVVLITEVLLLSSTNKELLGRKIGKDKPKQQAEDDNEACKSTIATLRKGERPITNHNGICLTCYFKNDCSMTEGDIFRDDTKQVADCGLYMKETSEEGKHDTEMQKM